MTQSSRSPFGRLLSFMKNYYIHPTRMIIEDRKFLLLSAGALLAFFAVGLLLNLLAVPEPPVSLAMKTLGVFVTLPFVLCMCAVCLSFLIHAYRHGNYGWILVFLIFSFVAAYIYGFVVASNPT